MTGCNASVTVVEGEEATLHCHVSGQPRPRVTWRRPELGTRPVLEAAPGGGFLVREAVVRDSGVYTCTATNRFGQEATCNTSLIVIGKQNCNLHLKLCNNLQKISLNEHLLSLS